MPASQSTLAPRINLLLVIAYLGFISLGLPDTVTGIAWPGVRGAFSLSQSNFGQISIAVGAGYLFSSFFTGKLTHLLGIGTLLSTSSLLVTAALFGTSVAPAWEWFLACAVVVGLGSGAIDAGLNAYVASHFSARHVNWLHACYSLGATLGPLLMTAAVVQAQSWRLGYSLIAFILLALAVCFVLTQRRWSDRPSPAPDQTHVGTITIAQTLQHPLVWLQVVTFFIYTGLELMVGHWSFTLLTESRAILPDRAGLIASSYFGAICAGRVALGSLADRIGVDRLVRYSTIVAIIGAALFAFGSSVTWSTAGLLLLGFNLAPVFPCLMSRTPDRLGPPYAVHAVGFQVCAAMTGAAAIPAVAGVLASRHGLEVVARLGLILAVALCLLHETLLLVSRRQARAPRQLAKSS